jgi:hypothetical protein
MNGCTSSNIDNLREFTASFCVFDEISKWLLRAAIVACVLTSMWICRYIWRKANRMISAMVTPKIGVTYAETYCNISVI